MPTGRGEGGLHTAELVAAWEEEGEGVAEALAAIVTMSAANTLKNEAAGALFNAARHKAVRKPSGGPRTIAMGGGLAKLRDALVERRHRTYLRGKARANLGMGVPGGVEAHARLAQASYAAGRDGLFVDVTNAYYNAHLGAIAGAIGDNPELRLYVAAALGHERTATFGRGTADELTIDVRDGVDCGGIMSMALFSATIEPSVEVFRQTARLVANVADDIQAHYSRDQPAAEVVAGVRAAATALAASGLHVQATKTYFLTTQERADELAKAFDDEQAASAGAPGIKPRFATEGHIVCGVPVGSPEYVLREARARLKKASDMADAIMEATDPLKVRGAPMAWHAAAALMRTCVTTKATFLARALGPCIAAPVAEYDASINATYRRICNLPTDDATDTPDQRALWDRAKEARSARGLGYTPTASILDAGYVAATVSSTAALLRHLGEAVTASTGHGADTIGVVPPDHDATVARLTAAGLDEAKLASRGATMQAMAEAGAAGMGKGTQRYFTAHMAKARDKARSGHEAIQPLTRVVLTMGGGKGYTAAFASRRYERNRMENRTWTEMMGEVLGRDAVPQARTCHHCPAILDKQGLHAAACPALAGFRTGAHDDVRDALVCTFRAGKSQIAGAVGEPHLGHYPETFGARLPGGVDARADVLVTDSSATRTFIDATVGWAAQLSAIDELIKPGRAEEVVREKKRVSYNASYADAGDKVHTLYVSPHGDVTGEGAMLLKRLTRQRAKEKAGASARRDEKRTYNNLITSLREALSRAFWRQRGLMREAARHPRNEWAAIGIVLPPEEGEAAPEVPPPAGAAAGIEMAGA